MTATTAAFKNYSVATTTAGTTDSTKIYKQGYRNGTVTNPSAVTRTVTYYGLDVQDDGTESGPYPLKDQDGAAVSQILLTGEMWELPSACSPVPVLVAITTTGATTGDTDLLFHFEG